MRRHMKLSASRKRRSTNQRQFKIESLEPRQLMAVVLADFNNDGYDDMATGIPGENSASGAISVVYGTSNGLTVTGDQSWHQNNIGRVSEAGDQFGAALAAGDFNNDGVADLAIGVPGEDLGDIPDAGGVVVMYGSTNYGLTTAFSRSFDQDSHGMEGLVEAYDRFGLVLSSGDYDGDGYDDLAVGVPHENVGSKQDAGVVHIIYGSSVGLNALGNQVLYQGKSINGTPIQGTADHHDHFGAALASANFNNDVSSGGRGIDDLAIGAPGEDLSSLYDVGAVNVIYGTSNGLRATGNQLYTQDSPGFESPAEAWDNFGSSLAAGNFNDDSFADLAIGTPNEDHGSSRRDAGVVHVAYGQAAYGFENSSTDMWHQNVSGIEGAAEAYDYFAASLAAGDFNNDGRDDLAIGVPGEDINSKLKVNAGLVQVMYGTATGISTTDRVYYQGNEGVEGKLESGDSLGSALATGDSDGDGFADLAVAAGGEAVGSRNGAGAVSVLRGQNATNLRTDNDRIWYQDMPGVLGGSEAGDHFGGFLPKSIRRTGVPALQSNPGASNTLFLDFDGGTSLGAKVPEFSMDTLPGFNWTELSMIADIWSYVAEDFAPFDLNVTTVLPSNGEIFRVLIGGDGTNLKDDPTSGWGPGDFTDNSLLNNDVYVFSGRVQGWSSVKPGDNFAAMIGTTASHEAGHGFGLDHKGTFVNGMLTEEYSDGDDNRWTPIMGANLNTDRTIWTQDDITLAPTGDGITEIASGNNDIAELQSEIGLRSDDHSGDLNQATNLGTVAIGVMRRDTGLIRTRNDRDAFRFEITSLATYKLTVSVADVGANLDSRLKLFDANGVELQVAAPTTRLKSSIIAELTPGIYYAQVGSEAKFTGDVGYYTLRAEWYAYASPGSEPAMLPEDPDPAVGRATKDGDQAADTAREERAAKDQTFAVLDDRPTAKQAAQTAVAGDARRALFEELGDGHSSAIFPIDL